MLQSLALVIVLGLTACAGSSEKHLFSASQIVPNQISTTIDSHGWLWRLLTDDQHVYVDHSEDRGKSYSQAVVVNAQAQKIRGNNEDRPHIAVNAKGVVYVTYAADDYRPWTAFFSSSIDGLVFSKPVPVSDQAKNAQHGLVNLAVNKEGVAVLFWHDNREHGTDASAAALYWAKGQASGTVSAGQKIAESQCECCAIAMATEPTGEIVLFTRQVYFGQIRDHGFVRQGLTGAWQSWRATNDGWNIEACPEQGPALSIDHTGRYHAAWFTQGARRQGLFYAYSDEQGRKLSEPKAFGDAQQLAGHPALAVMDNQIGMVWSEFDGNQTHIRFVLSKDQGLTWSAVKTLAHSSSEAGAASLKVSDAHMYVSWYTKAEGYRLIPAE
ncbi:MAG: exo-alpha-sialidase [Methylococcaceae bacterium]